MNSIDLVVMGLKNLFRRKTRTFLTVLGVIIGTASIVIMVSLGFGMKYSYQKQVEQMGSVTTIDVYSGGMDMGMSMGGGNGASKTGVLDDAAVAKFAKLKGVKAATPIIESYVRMVSGKYTADVSIKGILPETMKDFDMQAAEGRLLLKDDGSNVVFGSTIPANFMDQKARSRMMYYGMQNQNEKPKVNVLKDKLEMTFDTSYGDKRPPIQSDGEAQKPPKLFKIKGVGLLTATQKESDYGVYVDINFLKKSIQENAQYQSRQGQGKVDVSQQLKYQRAMIKVKSIDDVKSVQQAVKDMGFQASSLNDILDSMKKTSATIQLILGGIGAISLLVAAIGITNTMVMSIYERTREIGIMKVIGASIKDIKKLFLFESGMIGLMGGIIGLLLSEGASLLMNTVGKGMAANIIGVGGEDSKMSIIPVWLIFSVLGFTFLVGLISGYYPAKRAMKLSALEAIKTE